MAQQQQMKPPVVFGIGLFFGLLVGVFATIALSGDGGDGPPPQPQATQHSPHGPGGVPAQPSGAGGQPSGPAGGAGHAGGGDATSSFAKVHFMKKFVKALTELPENRLPNPRYKPLVKEGAEPIVCASCHNPQVLNIEAMKSQDPGDEAVEPLRRQPRFMLPLMTKWVARLNKDHRDRLTKQVTCTDCHGIDPREAWDALPPLMKNFVMALKEKPKNSNPAAKWKPLLKDPKTPAMLCSVCHGETGSMMERNLDRLTAKRIEKYAEDKDLMISLMEHWMGELNRNARSLLVKAVACIDCHETDPRK